MTIDELCSRLENVKPELYVVTAKQSARHMFVPVTKGLPYRQAQQELDKLRLLVRDGRLYDCGLRGVA